MYINKKLISFFEFKRIILLFAYSFKKKANIYLINTESDKKVL